MFFPSVRANIPHTAPKCQFTSRSLDYVLKVANLRKVFGRIQMIKYELVVMQNVISSVHYLEARQEA